MSDGIDQDEDYQYEPDDLSEFVTATAQDSDPFGFDFGQDLNQDRDPDSKFHETGNPSDSVAFGPECVIMAGYTVDEIAMVRILLDKAGGQAVKVVPVTEQMLDGSLEAALEVEEPDIRFVAQTTPEVLATTWTQRTLIFGGMPWAAQVTLIELLDQNWKGTPPFMVYVAANMLNKDMVVRDVLMGELEKQIHRDVPQPTMEPHEETGRVQNWRTPAAELIKDIVDPDVQEEINQKKYDKLSNEALRELEDY